MSELLKNLKEPVFVTGYPNFMVRSLVRQLVGAGVETIVLVKDEFSKRAQKDFEDLPSGLLHQFSGDVVNMDLGLSGGEVREILSRVRTIFHLAGVYHLEVSERETRLVNLEGTRNVLALARRCTQLERLVHYSTSFVSGTRVGVIMEEELDLGQTFRNPYEQSKFFAEKLVRQAMSDIPISVVRPSLVVGDSRTGEIDRFEGPHFFMYVLVHLPLNVALPLPGHGQYPLSLVPADYVRDAMIALAGDPAAQGKTFHLVDPNPLSANRIFELVANNANKKPPRNIKSVNFTNAILQMGGLKTPWKSPRVFVDTLNRLVLYNSMNTASILTPKGICCPAFPDYVGSLVNYIRAHKMK